MKRKNKQSRAYATFDQLIRMRTDNTDLSRDLWCLTDTHRVTLTRQKLGYKPSESIDMTPAEARKFCRWFMKEVTLSPPKRKKK